ncbi:hypothetical protein C3L57_07985, partial [Veillonellaceae bacterium M2-8]|nr:hypothetical protein [Veillonellaceae bacterium M2-8]
EQTKGSVLQDHRVLGFEAVGDVHGHTGDEADTATANDGTFTTGRHFAGLDELSVLHDLRPLFCANVEARELGRLKIVAELFD